MSTCNSLQNRISDMKELRPHNEFVCSYSTTGGKYFIDVYYSHKFKGCDIVTESSGGGGGSFTRTTSEVMNNIYFGAVMSGIRYKKTTGKEIYGMVALYYHNNQLLILPTDDPRVLSNKELFTIKHVIVNFSSVLETVRLFLKENAIK